MIEFHGHFREHFEPLIWESEPWERVADLSTVSESSMNGDRNDREIKSAPKWCGECCHEKLHASEVEGLYFLSRLWGCPKSYGRIWSLGSFSNLWSFGFLSLLCPRTSQTLFFPLKYKEFSWVLYSEGRAKGLWSKAGISATVDPCILRVTAKIALL